MNARTFSRRTRPLSTAGAAGLLLLLSSPAGAQAPETFDPLDAISRGFGLSEADGLLRGVGPDYLAAFDAGSFTFVPALGRAAATSMPIEFRLADVRLGDRVLVDAAVPVAPERAGDLVVYRHAGVDERYEVRADGVHQTFLFHELPAGGGDLVVRGRLRTDLVPRPAGAGARFDLPGIGGVSWGGVTGVDADGRTAAGELFVEGDALVLSLPDAFVREASLPLLLDPLVGSAYEIAGGGNDDSAPDVAFDATEDVYCAVWQRWFAADHVEVRAGLFSFGGTPQGPTIVLATNPLVFQPFEARHPSVASVNKTDRFLAVWQEAVAGGLPAVKAKSIRASDGATSGTIVVSPAAGPQTDPVVGGERTDADDDALVVWRESGTGIRVRQVHVPAGVNPQTPSSAITLRPDSFLAAHSEPAISRSAGDGGRFLVAWQRTVAGGDTTVEARVVDRDGFPLSLVAELSDLPALREGRPAVDGDGTRWIAAWERNEIWFPTQRDVVARAIAWDGTGLQLGDVESVVSFPDDDQYAPSVAFTGEHALVLYADAAFDMSHVVARTLDPYTALTYGAALIVLPATGRTEHTAAASEWSGGDAPGALDDVLFTFDWSPDGSPDVDVLARRYDGAGAPIDLGGGCAGGGVNVNPGAMQGNDGFTPRVLDAEPFAPAFLVVSPAAQPFVSGVCTWTPALLASAPILAAVTGPDGGASVTVPIPDDAGGWTVYTQWAILFAGGGSPLLGGVSFSNALEVEILTAN